MEQTTKRRQEQPTQQMTTGNNQSNNKSNLMTDYLENNSVVPTVNKAAELTPEERLVAVKAINYYRNLSLDQIETILNKGLEEPKKKAKGFKKSYIILLVLVGIALAAIITTLLVL